ncbi:WbqC family protein [Streptosporangium sp. NPDC051022]|uniref:WbqC family protein n=1 Tax=Streptosporangium sp. NPDC051022 TaxID=3155752 RepID=UPI00341EECD3
MSDSEPSPAALATSAASAGAPYRDDVLVAHQPAFLPWLGYLARLTDLRRLVLLDQVQFSDRGWQHRNYIRGTRGDAQLLGVPVRRRFGQPIHQVRTAPEAWQSRHWRTLTQVYGRAPYWPEWAEPLQAIYQRDWEYLIDLNEALLRLLLDGFGLQVALIRASTLAPAGHKNAMLIDLCRRTGTRVLRTGTGATGYLDVPLLAQAGISVEIATYQSSPPSDATSSPGTGGSAINARTSQAVPLSALDALLHHGPNARHLLTTGARLRPWTGVEA